MRREPTEAQRLAAKVRKEKFREIAKQVSKLSPEQRLELANRVAIVTIEGRSLSVHNQCLLVSQRASVTIVGGFRQWKAAGRSVRKGEHGLMIWVPCMPGQSAGDTPQPEAIDGEVQTSERPRFIMGTVFDVAQTCEMGEGFGESEAA